MKTRRRDPDRRRIGGAVRVRYDPLFANTTPMVLAAVAHRLAKQRGAERLPVT
jgi:hypothetical protein